MSRFYSYARTIKRFLFIRVDMVLYTAPWPPPTASISPGEVAPTGMVFQEIRPEHVPWIIEQAPKGYFQDDLQERLRRGRGFMALMANRLAGYAWCTSQARNHEGIPPFLMPIQPAPGTLYLFDQYVMPEYRRNGFTPRFIRFITKSTASKDIHAGFFFTAHRGMGTHAVSAGYQRAGILRFRRFMGFDWRDISALAPYLAASETS